MPEKTAPDDVRRRHPGLHLIFRFSVFLLSPVFCLLSSLHGPRSIALAGAIALRDNSRDMYYEALFQRLNGHRVKYLVCGGVAVNLHGVPRYTKDTDLLADLGPKNLGRLWDALISLGYKPVRPVTRAQFTAKDAVRWLREEKNAGVFSFVIPDHPFSLVDVLLESPVQFQDARKNFKKAWIGDLMIPFISMPDLIKMKKKSGAQPGCIRHPGAPEGGEVCPETPKNPPGALTAGAAFPTRSRTPRSASGSGSPSGRNSSGWRRRTDSMRRPSAAERSGSGRRSGRGGSDAWEEDRIQNTGDRRKPTHTRMMDSLIAQRRRGRISTWTRAMRLYSGMNP